MHHNCYENLITPGVALFVFLGVLIVSLLIAGFTTCPSKFDQTRTKIFMVCLAPLSVAVTFLFYYAVVSTQIQQSRQAIITMTADLRKNMLNGVIDILHDSHHKIPHFVASLFPLIACECIIEDENSPENNLLKHQISYKIFHLLESFIIAAPFIEVDLSSFVVHFLQRMSSKQLHEQWLMSKLDFNEKTRQVGDLLFVEAAKLNTLSAEEFDAAAERLGKNKTFLKIIFD